jgi:cation transport regulator ChaB
MPLDLLKKLPVEAKEIYESTYKSARGAGKSEMVSSKIAITAVKKKFTKKKGVWVTKSMALKFKILKSGFFNRDPVFEIPLVTTDVDSEGQMVAPEFLDKIVNEHKLLQIGDIEHERIAKLDGKMLSRRFLTKYKNTEGLYYLKEYKKDGNKLVAKIGMNKSHPLYSDLLSEHKKGNYLAASAEFEDAFIKDGVIHDANVVGWSITNMPINKNAVGYMLN